MISEEYLSLLRQMVETNPDWGCTGATHAKTVLRAAVLLKCKSALDYGCGTGSLRMALKGQLAVANYDPVRFPDGRRVCDMVCCIDVLEHVEPTRITQVLDDIRAHARIAVYMAISLRDAHALLPDGRNAHLTVRTAEQWRSLIEKRFKAVEVMEGKPDELVLLCLCK